MSDPTEYKGQEPPDVAGSWEEPTPPTVLPCLALVQGEVLSFTTT